MEKHIELRMIWVKQQVSFFYYSFISVIKKYFRYLNKNNERKQPICTLTVKMVELYLGHIDI